jgi:MFS family permease
LSGNARPSVRPSIAVTRLSGVSLAAGAVLSLGLAADARPLVYVPLVVLAAMAYGILFTPAFALIADGAEHVGLAQGMAFGFMNAAWAVGAMIGPAAGGAIAGATGDWIPFVLAAALCASTLAALRSAHERSTVLVDRLAGDAARVGRE